MAVQFGVVAIPESVRDERTIALDPLLPHVQRRAFYAESAPPAAWPADTHGLIVDSMNWPADMLDRLPGLRVISYVGTGVGNRVDLAHATRRGIVVCNVPDWGNQAIAEFTFALLLAVAKQLRACHAMATRPEWQRYSINNLELGGMTIGLVGLGNIGQRVAEIACALGMRVVCTTRQPRRPRAMRAEVEHLPLDDLLRQSNVLSLHAALTDETRGMIGARELALLPPGAIVINTARGALLDTDALVAALQSGHVWGAGLDVFEQEPLPAGHPLTRLENVVLAPHAAGLTGPARRKLYTSCVRNIDNFAAGTPTNVVNPEVLGS